MLVLHRIGTAATAIALAGASLLPAAGATAPKPLLCTDSGAGSRYVVLFEPTTTRTAATEEIEGQCGSVVRPCPDIGVAVAGSADEAFGTCLGPHRAFSAERERTGAGEQRTHGSPAEPR